MSEQGWTKGALRRCGGTTPRYMAIADEQNRYIVFQMADAEMDLEHGKPIAAPSVDEQYENCSRLVACWNALAGIPTAALPDVRAAMVECRNSLLSIRDDLHEYKNGDAVVYTFAAGNIASIDATLARLDAILEQGNQK